jgi:hypothetical protein
MNFGQNKLFKNYIMKPGVFQGKKLHKKLPIFKNFFSVLILLGELPGYA